MTIAEARTQQPSGSEAPYLAPSNLVRRVSGETATWIFALDILLVTFLSIFTANHDFWSIASFQNIASDSAEGIVLAVGMALLLGSGEFDISLGANLLLASVLGGMVAAAVAGPNGSDLWPAGLLAALVCVLSGAGVGLVNGLVVTRLRVNSLIATLAMLGIATGVADILTGGTDLSDIPQGLQYDFGIKLVVGIPLPALIALVVWLVAWVGVATTRYGMRLLAMGSSRDAAVRAGLHVERQLTSTFVVVGGLAGLCGLFDLTRFATTNLSGHQTDALAALTAAVIGGTSLFGGHISMPGVLAGALLAIILQDGLIILGLSAFYQLVAIGVVLIVAVFIDQRRRPRSDTVFRRR
ncbi:MAG TPA: ABC transporter permease [Acidimicrobiales bacterium]|nr:ABC transporter permease [Acidimicrobiales bacterium]